MATKTLSVVISGDAGGAQKAFQQTSKGADDLATKITATGKQMASVGKKLSIGITAPIAAFAAFGLSELDEAAKVTAQTEAAIKSTGGAANVTKKQVQDLAGALAPLGKRAAAFSDLPTLVAAVTAAARPGDHVLVMSNGGFGGVHQKLLDALAARVGAAH